MQVIGVGAHNTFEGVRDFLDTTDLDPVVPLLWEQSGNLWRLNEVQGNSAVQLYSFDFNRRSDMQFFNDTSRAIFLDAAIQIPWSPVDRTDSLVAG